MAEGLTPEVTGQAGSMNLVDSLKSKLFANKDGALTADQAKPMDDVSRRSDNLFSTTAADASELKNVTESMNEVKNDGVLSEEELNNQNQYSETELKAMGVEDKKAFLSELQALAKERGPRFAMELQKNLKEGKLTWVNFQRGEVERKLQEKMELFSNKKAAIEADRDAKVDKAREKYEKDDEKAQRKSKNKIRKIALKLKKNSTVKEFSHNVHGVVEGYFNFDRTEEVSRGISAKRDEVKDNGNVAELIAQIKAESTQLQDTKNSRQQELLAELGAITNGAKQELGQLKDSTLTEVRALKQRLSELEQQQYDLEDEITKLEYQMADRERLQTSIDTLQDELREFSFKDATKALSGMEDRAANTLSMDALSVDKDNIHDRLDGVGDAAKKLEDDLEVAMGEVESAIETSYLDQADALQKEKDGLVGEKQGAHNELIKNINEPFAAAIEKMRETTDLREGSNAIEIVSAFASLTGQVGKAEKQIGKSAAALEKFKAGVEKRFGVLGAKLEKSKAAAQSEADNRYDNISDSIANAQSLAEGAKEGNFTESQENWFSKVWKKVVG